MPRKSLYDKGNELLELAKQETDPEIRKLRVQAAKRYFNVDLQTTHHILNAIVILVSYIILIASAILSVINLGYLAGVGIFIFVFLSLCLLLGVYMRLCGKISETNLLIFLKEGFKAISLLKKKNPGQPE